MSAVEVTVQVVEEVSCRSDDDGEAVRVSKHLSNDPKEKITQHHGSGGSLQKAQKTFSQLLDSSVRSIVKK